MDWYWKTLAVACIAGSMYYSVETYTNGLKAQKAMELGYQECTELNSFNKTIILYKRECK